MTKMLKNLLRFSTLTLVGFAILGHSFAFAESTSVVATVPSRACPQFTIISTNVPEVLADNSQKILVSVQLKDCDEAIMANASVTLVTNRGAVDHADVVTAAGEVIEQGYGTGVAGITSADGLVYYNVYTDVPGEAVISLRADNVLLLGTKTVKFLPVPFPKNISISVVIPPVIGKLLPNFNEKSSSLPLFVPEQQFDDAKIVNLGVDLRLPFWLFVLLVVIILAIPTLSTSNIMLLARIRKEQRAETTKIEQEVEEIHEEITAELNKSKESEINPQN